MESPVSAKLTACGAPLPSPPLATTTTAVAFFLDLWSVAVRTKLSASPYGSLRWEDKCHSNLDRGCMKLHYRSGYETHTTFH